MALFKDLASIDLDIGENNVKENRKHLLYLLNKYILDEIYFNAFLSENQIIKEEVSSQSSSRILEDSMEYEPSGSEDEKISKGSTYSHQRNMKELSSPNYEQEKSINFSFNEITPNMVYYF